MASGELYSKIMQALRFDNTLGGKDSSSDTGAANAVDKGARQYRRLYWRGGVRTVLRRFDMVMAHLEPHLGEVAVSFVRVESWSKWHGQHSKQGVGRGMALVTMCSQHLS